MTDWDWSHFVLGAVIWWLGRAWGVRVGRRKEREEQARRRREERE